MGLDFYKALNAERYLQDLYNSYIPIKKFGGYTECFINLEIQSYKRIVNTLFPDPKEVVENLMISWR